MSACYIAHLLKGRRFLVTGGTGGAGSRTAIEISRVGGICTLVCRDGNKGEKVLRELMGAGHNMLLPVDKVVDVSSAGPFDGWFDAEGAEWVRPLSQSYDSEDCMWVNFQSKLGILSAAGSRQKPLIKDGGSIVFMSSVAAVRGQTGMSLYCASKAAIEGLTRAAAVELAPRRIRVNCLRCGGFDSPMHRRLTQRMTPDAIEAYANRHLLGFGRDIDIANAALFLLSDASKWVTGAAFTIDGGMSAK